MGKMITSELIEVKYTNDNNEIEKSLKALGIEPLRWAVVDIKDNKLVISVSYEK